MRARVYDFSFSYRQCLISYQIACCYPGSIEWFAPALMDIANMAALSSKSANPIELHISIYVTCLCNPEAIPPIPNCDVTIIRPSVYRILADITTPPRLSSTDKSEPGEELPPISVEKRQSTSTEPDSEVGDSLGSRLSWIENGGGLAVCASGPESLTGEASNAVARLQISGRGLQIGKIAFHSEVFTL